MKDIFKDYLFYKHILVLDSDSLLCDSSISFNALVALGQQFGIRIKKNPEMARLSMIQDAQRCLGYYVPEPFYRGFPDTVRELTREKLLFDQLLHYTQTYGCGWWDEPGHSVFESKDFERVAYNEDVPPKDFNILPEGEAMSFLKESLMKLMESNRPLNADLLNCIKEGYKEFGISIIPDKIPCKSTVIFLLYETKDLFFCRHLKLSDTIKLLNYIQWTQYHSENLKKLNLRNRDRKLITNVINELIRLDQISGLEVCNYVECFEKRKIWCGLLHHIHYKVPDDEFMIAFVSAVRSGANWSIYSSFENRMAGKMYPEAAKILAERKGKSELVRHLNYILSRCETEEEVKEVLSCLE